MPARARILPASRTPCPPNPAIITSWYMPSSPFCISGPAAAAGMPRRVLENTERILFHHIVPDPLDGLGRRHTPVGGAHRKHLDEGETLALELVPERLHDGAFRHQRVLRRIHGDPFD